MLAAVQDALPADAAVMAAAVADWRVEASAQKIKKGENLPALALTENPDILATVCRHEKRPKVVVGFAAETENVVANAAAKRERKGCDLILANDVSDGVFGEAHNTVHLVGADGVEDWPTLDKGEVARRLVARVAEMLVAPSS
ncbi:MAG: phosphopantothenoylcysteine decarboxylase, partial [Pseudomonadota bacterium]